MRVWRQPVHLIVLVLLTPALAGCFAGSGDGGEGGGSGFLGGSGAGGASDAPYEPGWPAIEDATVRPGVRIVSSTGQCTSNFVYASPDNRTLYLGFAAHCVEEDAIGAPLDIAGGAVKGRLAYSSWHTMEELGITDAALRDANDFALAEIPDEDRHLVHPAVLHFGGPTGLLTDVPANGDRVLTYGNTGLRQGAEPTNPREGVVTFADEWYTEMYIATPGLPGDSGSGVMTRDGQALGVLIHLQVAPQAGANGAGNLAPLLDWAAENADLDVELKTWELLRPGSMPGNEDATGLP